MTQRGEKGSRGLEVLHLSCLSASFLSWQGCSQSTVGFCSDPSKAVRHKSKMGCSLQFFESYVCQSSRFVFLSANVFTSASAEMLQFQHPVFRAWVWSIGAVLRIPLVSEKQVLLWKMPKKLTCFAEFKESERINGVAVIKNLRFRHSESTRAFPFCG